MHRQWRSSVRLVLCYLFVSLSSSLLFGQANHVVISEVYGGGGNSGSTWKNDFVELYNPTNAPVNVTGWSVQYASAAGVFGNFKTYLSGVIQPKGFFLIQESQGVEAPQISRRRTLSVASQCRQLPGKLPLYVIRLPSPVRQALLWWISLDMGTRRVIPPTCSEGSGSAPTLSNTTSVERKASSSSTAATLAPGGSEEKAGNGWDTNDNASDFVSQSAINPQNSASPKEPPPIIQAGVGVVYFSQPAVKADTSMGVTLVVKGVSSAVITGVRFPKYPLFDWSHCSLKVSSSSAGQPLVSQTRRQHKHCGACTLRDRQHAAPDYATFGPRHDIESDIPR